MRETHDSEPSEEEQEDDMGIGNGCLGMAVGIALVATIAAAIGGYIFVKYVLGA